MSNFTDVAKSSVVVDYDETDSDKTLTPILGHANHHRKESAKIGVSASMDNLQRDHLESTSKVGGALLIDAKAKRHNTRVK